MEAIRFFQCEVVHNQLKELSTVVHPITNKVLSVHRHSLADGKPRGSNSGGSTARSSFPLADAPEHYSQLPDMSVIFSCPEWTPTITKDLEKEYNEWSGEKSDNSTNRRKFAQKNLGNTGLSSATKIDMEITGRRKNL